jgi:hypothetical protein
LADAPTREQPIAATTNGKRSAATCRWATPTLFLQAPYWFEAENSPWACVRDIAPRVLSMTDQCAVCSRWELRRDETAFRDAKPEIRRVLTRTHGTRPITHQVSPPACDPLLGASFATARKRSGHTTRDRYERFRERDHLDESGD